MCKDKTSQGNLLFSLLSSVEQSITNQRETYLGRNLSYSYYNYAQRVEILAALIIMKMLIRSCS